MIDGSLYEDAMDALVQYLARKTGSTYAVGETISFPFCGGTVSAIVMKVRKGRPTEVKFNF